MCVPVQTELCDASLDVWVAQGNSLSFDEYFDFLRQMLMALDIIHRNGLVHLDIKVRPTFTLSS
jgi:serine/threonine protein kinase